MAIDILSRRGTPTIVVGDAADMNSVIGLFLEEDKAFLHMRKSEDEEILIIPLSEQAFRNVEDMMVAIFVSLSPEDEITEARRCHCGYSVHEHGRKLPEPELKILAEDIVAGDFNLDFLR